MKTALLVSSVLLLAACGSDSLVAPDFLQGSYTLRTLNGSQLPALASEDETARHFIQNDRLEFDGRGKVYRVTEILREDAKTGLVTKSVQEQHLDYRLIGDSVVVGYLNCGNPAALCSAPDRGTASHEAVELKTKMWDGPTLSYSRALAL